MTYSVKDLERARVFLNHYSPDDTDVAQLIATVRREALEEAAKAVGSIEATPWGFAVREDIVKIIRALKDKS